MECHYSTEENNSTAAYKRLAEELKLANQKLLKAESLRSQFLSNVKNEINNPFASILGLAQNIMDFKNEDLQKIKTMAAMIHKEAANLNAQLKNIFAAAEIEAGEAIPGYIVCTDIYNLATNICNCLEDSLKNRVHFIPSLFEDKDFLTDPAKLEIIIANILTNAAHFSDALIYLTIFKKSGNLHVKVLVNFQDKIKQEEFLQGFENPEIRLGLSLENANLGMSVVKCFVEMLNGNIYIKNSRGLYEVNLVFPKPESEEAFGFASDSAELFF
jgi:signal transduction histidine kinase